MKKWGSLDVDGRVGQHRKPAEAGCGQNWPPHFFDPSSSPATVFGHLTPDGQSALGLGGVSKTAPADRVTAIIAAGGLGNLTCVDSCPAHCKVDSWMATHLQVNRRSEEHTSELQSLR